MDGKTNFMVLMEEFKNTAIADEVDYLQAVVLAEELTRMIKEENVKLRTAEKVNLIKNMSRLRVRAKYESQAGSETTIGKLAALSGEMVSLM